MTMLASNAVQLQCGVVTSGQKFPSKTLEMSLQATVQFPDHYTPPSGVDSDDPFCVGVNTYADVSITHCVYPVMSTMYFYV